MSPFDTLVRGEFEAMISIGAAENTRSLTNVDPARQSLRAKAHAPLMRRFMERSAAGEFRWVGTLYPTNAYAQDADTSLADFEDYVYATTYADADDPVGEWAIGTNKKIDRFIKNILFDEKIGGTIHMAVGAGYPKTGAKNVSASHWDMICDMRQGGRITVDGTPFSDSGEFLV